MGTRAWFSNIITQVHHHDIPIKTLTLFTGLTIIQFLSLLFIVTQSLFFLNITVNIATLILVAIITYATLVGSLFFEFSHTGEMKPALRKAARLSCIVVFCIIAIFAVSILFANTFIDPTWDSNVYHKPYSIFFVNGWNPTLMDNPPALFGGKIQGLDIQGDGTGGNYPKAAELIASYIYLLTNSLESVKAINLIIAFTALAIAIVTIIQFLPENRILAVIIALIGTFNPIWVPQSPQFYIDGFYSEIFFIIICLFLLFLKGESKQYIL
ncbi:MAG TPA: hypothetical protein VN372_07935, partial [Methanospirillum sp.]|nr:hypothetical protein [Methanospirillum sp.]